MSQRFGSDGVFRVDPERLYNINRLAIPTMVTIPNNFPDLIRTGNVQIPMVHGQGLKPEAAGLYNKLPAKLAPGTGDQNFHTVVPVRGNWTGTSSARRG